MPSSAPRLVLLCGLPGAGKTTLARRLEEQIPALRLSPDEWLTALGIDLWDGRARDRVEGLQWELARRILRLGGSAVLENGYWTRAEREARRQQAAALGPHVRVELRYLDAPLDELWQRLERRNASREWRTAPITRAKLEEWANIFEPPSEGELAAYDPPAEARI
jgi:predicted kinase